MLKKRSRLSVAILALVLCIGTLLSVSAAGPRRFWKWQNLENTSQPQLSSEKAMEMALAHLELNSSDVDLVLKNYFKPYASCYYIEFVSGTIFYDVKVSCYQQRVVNADKERLYAYGDNYGRLTFLSYEDALKKALEHIGVSREKLTNESWELDSDDGRIKYEMKLLVDGGKYEIEVDAVTGKIVEFETKGQGKARDDAKYSGYGYIGKDRALEIVLSKAGLQKDQIRGLEIDFDDDHDNRAKYEIDFKSGGYEYEADVDAYSGSVLDYKVERDD